MDEVDDAVGDDYVDGLIVERNGFDVTFEELDVSTIGDAASVVVSHLRRWGRACGPGIVASGSDAHTKQRPVTRAPIDTGPLKDSCPLRTQCPDRERVLCDRPHRPILRRRAAPPPRGAPRSAAAPASRAMRYQQTPRNSPLRAPSSRRSLDHSRDVGVRLSEPADRLGEIRESRLMPAAPWAMTGRRVPGRVLCSRSPGVDYHRLAHLRQIVRSAPVPRCRWRTIGRRRLSAPAHTRLTPLDRYTRVTNAGTFLEGCGPCSQARSTTRSTGRNPRRYDEQPPTTCGTTPTPWGRSRRRDPDGSRATRRRPKLRSPARPLGGTWTMRNRRCEHELSGETAVESRHKSNSSRLSTPSPKPLEGPESHAGSVSAF